MLSEEIARRHIVAIILLVTASVSLFFAQSSYWINHTIFDQASFSSITTEQLTQQSSRDAIATAVVDRALEERPVIRRIAGDQAIQLTSGLLGSDASSQAIGALSSKTYAYLTSSNREDVTIELTSLKTLLSALIALAETRGAGENLDTANENIPDEVVLLRSDTFPDLSGVVTAMLWLGPLFWLITILGFGFHIYLRRDKFAHAVYVTGGAIIAVGVIGLLLVPFIPPPLAAAIPTINLRPVAENLATGFLDPFRVQMLYMIVAASVALVIFNQRYNLSRAVHAMSAKLSPSTSSPSSKKPSKENSPSKTA